MQQVLEEIPGVKIRILVVWEPVVFSDIAPPTTHALTRVSDSRAVQLWDRDRVLSDAMGSGDDVLWDYVAIYPPGARWGDTPPEPIFDGVPVVDAIDGVRRALKVNGAGP